MPMLLRRRSEKPGQLADRHRTVISGLPCLSTPHIERPMETAIVEQPQFFTVTQFAEKYPAFSEASLRWLLFHREMNGLSAAVVQLGRRLLIDEVAFVEWLRQHRTRSPMNIN